MGRHVEAIQQRAALSRIGAVRPANYRERRALRRMTTRGVTRVLAGYPDVWVVLR